MKCTITITEDNRLKVTTPYSPILVERFRVVPGSKPHYENGKFQYWTFPIMPDTVLMVTDVCGVIPSMLSQDVRQIIESQIKPALTMTKEVDLSILNGHVFQTTPYDHQRINLARAMQEDRWLFADEQGTGKTMPLCNRLKMMLLKESGRSALIVCPKSVIPGWQDQLQQHASLDCVLVTGTPAQKAKRIADPCKIKIAGYETVLAMQDAFLASPPTVLILDELQKVKNFTAKSSKVIRKISQQAKYVWGLSGTPAPNGLEDWLGVISAIDPKLLPVDTKTGFEARYCFKSRIGADGPFKISGYRNVEELHGYISKITSRVTKAEALDLPEKIISTRYVEMDGEQARIYRDLKRDAITHLNALKQENQLTVRNILTEQLRLLQVVGGFVPDDAGLVHEISNKCKLPAIRDIIEEIGDKQVVFWAAFVAEANFLAKWLTQEYGNASVTLTGQTPESERRDNVEAFRKGNARWFVGTAGAGGVGINGLQVCDTEIYYSRNFRMDYWKQSQDRCHRLGTKSAVSVIKLICQGTVDARVDDRLEEKDAMQDMMLMKAEDVL